jgi:hypothetical protein
MLKKIPYLCTLPMIMSVAIFLSGCQTQNTKPAAATAENQHAAVTPSPAPAESAPPAAAQTTSPPALVLANGAYRVKAGSDAPVTDSKGHVWQQDQGFSGGDVTDRDADTKLTGTEDPELFLSEHYAMDSFSGKVPNGNYTANLYFAETYDGITGPGMRVFSFNVQGHPFKNIDLWVKAGGPDRPYVVTVPVTVTDGIFHIDFTTQVENPEINAIELIPAQ